MAQTQALTADEIQAVFKDAAARQVELALAIAVENRWESFRAGIVDCQGQRLVLRPKQAPWIQKSLAGLTACVAFTKGAFRYFGEITFEREAAGQEDLVDAVVAGMPQQLLRHDRRAYERVDVPKELAARAVLWPEVSQSPKWSGQVLSISRGGLQMRTASSALTFLERGDLVQVAVSLGAENTGGSINAYFRAGVRDGDMALLGVEFREGLATLPPALLELLKKVPQK